jgi:transcription elongation factor Elf1
MSAIEFHCVFCGEKMHASPELAGRIAECSACWREVPVPGFPSGGRSSGCLPAFREEILRLDVNFLCRACRARLVIDGRWEGQAVDCPVCQAALTVPVWSGQAVADAPRQAGALSQEEIHFLSADPEVQFR